MRGAPQPGFSRLMRRMSAQFDIYDNHNSKLRFRTLLGIEPRVVPEVRGPASNRKNGRVGQRSPQRDPIRAEGVGAYA